VKDRVAAALPNEVVSAIRVSGLKFHRIISPIFVAPLYTLPKYPLSIAME
jgi:hypothetical protein